MFVFSDSEIQDSLPEKFRTPEIIAAVNDWRRTRKDRDGRLIGLSAIELRNAIYNVAASSEANVLSTIRSAATGGWVPFV